MTDSGWIKLHRSLLDHPIVTSKDMYLIQLWIYILLKVNYVKKRFLFNGEEMVIEKGSGVFGLNQIVRDLSKLTDENKPKFKRLKTCYYRRLLLLEKLGNVKLQPTNKFTVVTVCNWDKYQANETQVKLQRNSSETPVLTNKNDKNERNILSKDNKVKDRNDVVDFVLEQFKSRYGFTPIDKKPRQVAYNIGQITNTFIKNYGAIYEVKKGEKAEVQTIIARVFDKFMQEDYAKDTQYLDTFKRHLRKILEITGAKLINNSSKIQ